MFSKESLLKLNEADLRRNVIIPLLVKMGYKHVFEHHGAGELGKDIVCWKNDDLEIRRNLSIVAKASQIKGDTLSASDVLVQINQSFGSGFTDPVTGEKVEVDYVWVVSNQKIGREAIDSINSSIPMYKKNVSFINGDTLWDYVDKFLNTKMGSLITEISQEVENFDTHYYPLIKIENGHSTVSLEEKFPGASKEKPITLDVNFKYGDDEKSKDLQHKVHRLFKYGGSIEIPKENFSFKITPDLFSKIRGGEDNPDTLTISSLHPRTIPIEFSIIKSDGTDRHTFILTVTDDDGEYLHLKNLNEYDFIEIKFRLNPDSEEANFSFSGKSSNKNVMQVLRVERFLNDISTSSINIQNLNSNTRIFEGKIDNSIPPKNEWISFLEKCILIQKDLKTEIIIPDRDITNQDLDDADELITILKSGKTENKTGSGSIKFSREEIEKSEIIKSIQEYETPLIQVKTTHNCDYAFLDITYGFGKCETEFIGTIKNPKDILDEIESKNETIIVKYSIDSLTQTFLEIEELKTTGFQPHVQHG